MLSTAGRRLPARVLRVGANAQHHATGSSSAMRSRSVLGAMAHNRISAQHTRTFFGLRDLIFGDNKDAKTEDIKAVTTEGAPTGKQATTITAETATTTEAVVAVNQAPAPLVGSTDSIEYSVGKYARLADGGLMASCGKTMVLTTAVSTPTSANGRRKDFLPLMVDYRVKYHAAGLIPDTVRRNEMFGTDEEILQSRVIDRVIRPLFPRDYVDETQVIATVHSLDPTNDPLVLAVNSTSAALSISSIPWDGPIGCVRVVELEGQFVTNPTNAQRQLATMDILYAANEDRVLMIEAAGNEIPEDRMADALRFAHDAVQPIIAQQKELVKEHGKPKRIYPRTLVPTDVMDKAKEIGLPLANEVFNAGKHAKAERQDGERQYSDAVLTALRAFYKDAGREIDDVILQTATHDVFQFALRDRVLKSDRNSRFDGRGTKTIRALAVETDVLPMAHGSSVFSRGDTQALCSVTLGPLERGLRIRSATQDPNEDDTLKHAILHYEFPPYCVNETGRIGGANRRMIGHGALAEKAITPVLPAIDDFPYTIRMTSETMGSDGSSSMATVCGVTMALLDAGVPVKAPVAGISIGLVTEGDPFDGKKEINKYRLLTDILGTEDHYGDMDFKVAGTETGITAIQLDVKLPGVPLEILVEGIQHARKARSFILRKMALVLAEPRPELKQALEEQGGVHVNIRFNVPTASIGALIGSGGSNVREIEATTGCRVSIDRATGEIQLVGPADKAELAKTVILEQTATSAFYRVGATYEMRVVDVLDFGAILESTAPTKNRGFVHITELAHERIERIQDVVQVDQVLEFQCLSAGVSGKMSRKALLPPPPGQEGETAAAAPATPYKRPVSGTAIKRRSKGHAGGTKGAHTTGRPPVSHRRGSAPPKPTSA